jgi:hypothetical protein
LALRAIDLYDNPATIFSLRSTIRDYFCRLFFPIVLLRGKRLPWGQEMDDNLVVQEGDQGTQPAEDLHKQSGRDEHSVMADPMFVNPATGDYRVKDGSPALALGLGSFPMSPFGVQKPELAAIARTPELPGGGQAAKAAAGRDDAVKEWNGARVRNIRDEGEMSFYGLPGVTSLHACRSWWIVREWLDKPSLV